MKIICINEDNWRGLIIDKVYDAIGYDDDWYVIIDANNIKCKYLKEWFKPLSEVRNEKINKIINNENNNKN